MFEYRIIFPKCTIDIEGRKLVLITGDNLIDWQSLNQLAKHLFNDYDPSVLEFISISYQTKLENGKYITKPNKHIKKNPHYEVLLRSIVPIKKDYGDLNLQMFNIYANLYKNYKGVFSFNAFISYKQGLNIMKEGTKTIEFKQKSPLVLKSTLKQLQDNNDSVYCQILNSNNVMALKQEFINRYENENTTFYYILEERYNKSVARTLKEVTDVRYKELKFKHLRGMDAKNLVLEIDEELEEFLHEYAIDNRLIPVSNSQYLQLLFNSINYQPKENSNYEIYSYSKFPARNIRYSVNSSVMYAIGSALYLETDDDELYYKLMLGGAGSLRNYGFGVAYNQ